MTFVERNYDANEFEIVDSSLYDIDTISFN
jgi:hypothetical protein